MTPAFTPQLEVLVLHKPVSQGNHRTSPFGNIFETTKGHAEWRTEVTLAAKRAMRRSNWMTVEGPVAVDFEFYFDWPKRFVRLFPSVKPDLSKTIRSTEDSLTDAGVWKDDSQVVYMSAIKRYVTEAFQVPGARIVVRPFVDPNVQAAS